MAVKLSQLSPKSESTSRKKRRPTISGVSKSRPWQTSSNLFDEEPSDLVHDPMLNFDLSQSVKSILPFGFNFASSTDLLKNILVELIAQKRGSAPK